MIWLITKPMKFRDFRFEAQRRPLRDLIFVYGTLHGTRRSLTLSSLLEEMTRVTVVGFDGDPWAVDLEIQGSTLSIPRIRIGGTLRAEIAAATTVGERQLPPAERAVTRFHSRKRG